MTAVLDDMRAATDMELADAYRAADDDAAARAALAELGRRDQADRLARARGVLAAIRHEAECAVHAQFLAASEFCRGRLLSREGVAAGIAERDLWRLPADRVARFQAEELRDYHEFVSPRITVASYVRQRAAESRAARIEALDQAEATASAEITDDETGAITDDEYASDGPELARDAARSLRREPAAEEASQGRGGRPVLGGGHRAGRAEQLEPGGSATGRPDGHARPAGRELTVAERVEAYMRRGQEQAAQIMAGAQIRAAADEGAGGEVAVPERAAVARRDGMPQIPGDQLLDLLADRWFGRYARFPSRAALDVVTLFAAHCHCRDENGVLVFSATPRLFLLSAEPGSGKTKVLELLGMVVPNCYGIDLEPSGPGLAYSLNRERSTVLIDESDILFGRGQRRADVRAIINGGAYRHGTVLNGKGAKATRTAVFGPMAIAGLDSMEKATGTALEALLTRGVKIRMQRASGDDAPVRMGRSAEAEAVQAKKWLAAWAAQVRAEVADAEPELPEGLDGRPADMWAPLLAVADAAGGEWPARARAACAELTMAAPAAGEVGEDLAGAFAEFAAAFGAYGEDD